MALERWAASVAEAEGFLGALVAAVGEEDEDFAAGLRGELVVGGEVDGVVEERAAGVGGGKGAAADAGRPVEALAALIEAGSMARVSSGRLLVSSARRSTLTSKVMRKARSLGVRTSLRKRTADCCSRGRTCCWLPLVSRRMPMVRGRFFSWVRVLMVWGWWSSRTRQSEGVRLRT